MAYLVFLGSAVVVWFAGVRVARLAGTIAERTGAGDAVIGVLLLAVITSLPEVAASVTGAIRGAAALSVNNLLGGLAFQVAVLVVADAVAGRRAITAANTDPGVLLQAALNVLLLTIVAVGLTVGEVRLPGGVGVWSTALVPAYGASLYLITRRRRQAWRAARGPGRRRADGPPEDAAGIAGEAGAAADGSDVDGSDVDTRPLSRLVVATVAFALLILVAGYALTRSAESIAEATGLGAGFVGAVLLAAATSLPEISTATAAVRIGRPALALGDIFGTNLVDVTLIFVVDAVYAGPPVLGTVGRFSLLAALLGIATTVIYLVGLVERRKPVVLRLGIDSLLVLLTYLGGVALLYTLR